MSHKLTHLDSRGAAHMVDISGKLVTTREAVAGARVSMQTQVLELLEKASAKKGDVLATARIAGIMAAKKTSELIPLCHPLALNKVAIEFEIDHKKSAILIQARCVVEGKTGVEMEALTAASVAALTIYDMCKAVDPTMVIGEVKLLEKTGGKSGHWLRPEEGMSKES